MEKNEILKKQLSAIVGKSLNDLNFACEMMMLSFGEFELHAQGFTRVILSNDVLFTTMDYQSWDGTEESHNDQWHFGEKYRDKIIGGLVEATELSPVNDLSIRLNNGIQIEIIIANGYSFYHDEREQWVFFKRGDHSQPFITVYNKGLEIVTDW